MKLIGIESKREILQRAKSLNSGKFNKVFIAPDLTKNQQEHDKDLRESLSNCSEKSIKIRK